MSMHVCQHCDACYIAGAGGQAQPGVQGRRGAVLSVWPGGQVWGYLEVSTERRARECVQVPLWDLQHLLQAGQTEGPQGRQEGCGQAKGNSHRKERIVKK